jgi:cyclophilin family peptidyl-prolyl cis-trans isomerase
MDVVKTIEKVPTTSRGFHQDVPVEPVTILHASVDTGS